MKNRFSEIIRANLLSIDGVIGKVDDLLIQEDEWTVRYFVVNIQNTLPVRRVLVSTAAIEGFNFAKRTIATTLGSQQVIDSPRLDDNQPLSRQYEEALVEYYGWPIYWLGRAIQISPQLMGRFASNEATASVQDDETNLRSAAEICGYRIVANDGDAGYMKDLVINVNSWIVEYATAQPSSWLPSASSMFSTRHIEDIDWANRRVFANLQKQSIEPLPSSSTSLTGEPWSAQPFRPANQ